MKPVLALAALLCVGCTQSFVLKESHLFLDRRMPGVTRTDVAVPLPDGGTLRGWHLQVAEPRATLIYCYGNGEAVYRASGYLFNWARAMKVNILCVDYRGYGFSDGKASLAALREDVLRVFDATADLRAGRPTLVMGYSLGSLAASHLAANRPVDGLALVSGASSFGEVVDGKVPTLLKPFVNVSVDPVLSQAVQPKAQVATVKVPTLVAHGTKDEVLPVTCGDAFFAASPAAWKRYVRVKGAGHEGLSPLSGELKEAVEAWIQASGPGTTAPGAARASR